MSVKIALKTFLLHNGLQSDIALSPAILNMASGADREKALEVYHARLISKFTAGSFPTELSRSIREALLENNLQNCFLAVRSSSAEEDV
jgi:hypothetical protein